MREPVPTTTCVARLFVFRVPLCSECILVRCIALFDGKQVSSQVAKGQVIRFIVADCDSYGAIEATTIASNILECDVRKCSLKLAWGCHEATVARRAFNRNLVSKDV